MLATALTTASVFNMSAVLAKGAPADTEIRNTATATYDDDDGNTFNATSNEVIIKVAEVAGLTITAGTIEDSTPGTNIEPGDSVSFPFEVANVGNAPTNVYVPGIGGITVQNFTPDPATPIEVFDATGPGATVIGTVPAGGGLVTDLGGTPIIFAPDDIFVVKVNGTVPSNVPNGAPISVALGNTDDNTGPDTQNQPDNSDGGPQSTDVRTVDPTPGDTTDDPSNGEREASAVLATTIDARPLALAKVKKDATVTDRNIPSNAQDDILTYSLTLEVDDVDPSGLFVPADLEGTNITINGAPNQKRILVSDAIPAETRLNAVPTAPPGWTVVYAKGANDAASGSNALGIDWQTATPTTSAELADVNRVGFIFTGTVAKGTSVTGFEFEVVTSGVTSTTGTTIENIAQVFGQSEGDVTEQIIYDESGDDNPNNFTDGNTPPTPDGSDYAPGAGDDGIAPESDGDNNGVVDNPGDFDPGANTGTGDDGEANVVILPLADDNLVNGPKDSSDATGPSGGTQDDFTNKSTPTPAAGIAPTDTFNPGPVDFDNSLTNPGADFVANVVVEPISPARAAAASGLPVSTYSNTDGDDPANVLPNGTIVTITNPANADSASYTFNGSDFVLNTGNSPVNFGQVDPISADPANEIDYKVTVDLSGTVAAPGTPAAQLEDYAIPLVAFPDTGAPGFDTETVSNITIDRLYTGFIKLSKQSQIRDENGDILEAFTPTPAIQADPGDTIEYLITYENISRAAGGSATNNVELNANNLVITEDGDTTPNNWAKFTSHIVGSATASAGSITFFETSTGTGTPTEPTGDVVKYENTVTTVVAPGTSGTFEFDRLVNAD